MKSKPISFISIFQLKAKSMVEKVIALYENRESLILNIREGFIKEVLYNDYLASKSPRRKELLSLITDDFTVDSAEVD